MCGICGIFHIGKETIPDLEKIKEMMGYLHHRGPDSGGYYRDKKVALGHTRLSIIDLETGAQPLSNENETLWIVYNGEIFNYKELRKELLAFGHTFRTQSDTEVIVHAYEQWGKDCLLRFNGQWAFALWDKSKEEVFLSRDQYGICPLYYVQYNSIIFFASEIKALFANREIRRDLDPRGIKEFLTFWNPIAPHTVFNGIYQVPPAHYSVFSSSGIECKPYWRTTFTKQVIGHQNGNIDETIETVKEKLVQASRLRFSRSDVPVGAYLSGGLDSSIIATIINRHTDVKLNTFSIRFDDAEFDEGLYQQKIASRLGTEHHTIDINYKSIRDVFSKVIWHTEQPLLRSSPAPLFLLSGLVESLGYKVVVTGEGADEAFAGYDIFKEAKVRRFIARKPDSKIRIRLLEKLYPWMKRSPNMAVSFADSFYKRNLEPQDFFFSHRPRWNTTSSLQFLLNKDFIQLTDSIDPLDTLRDLLPDDADAWDDLNKAQWIEIATLLSGYLLSAQGDRMLMAHGVEGRFPFLDTEVMDFANTLPHFMKLRGLNEKYILKQAFGRDLPEEIVDRPKQPYRAPDAASFFFDTKCDWINTLTSETEIRKAGLFNPGMINRLIAKCSGCKGMGMSNTDNMRIVGILSLMLIHHLFIQYNGFGSHQRETRYIKVIDLISGG